MPATVIVGTQWGDEGKGKITDYFAEEAELVIRFQGGNNAGHTIVVGGETHKFHLLPSGVIHPGKSVVIGNGVVVDPEVLLKELSELHERGYSSDNLKISDRANVIMPYHKLMDGIEEKFKGKGKIGTTGRGIGPTYTEKVSRNGIRMADLLDPESLDEKLEVVLALKNRILKAYEEDIKLDKTEILEQYLDFGKKLSKYIADTPVLINSALEENKIVLFEGAQGTQLDIDHGTYPYVTSSNTVAGNACAGAGVGPTRINEVIGVVKAYTTRVGEGPFPTELTDEAGEHLREKGHEYGATTGRPRRCGWLDLVVVRYACRINGLTGLAVTRLDVIAGLGNLKICKAYELEGEQTMNFPSTLKTLDKCMPIYDELPGWDDLSDEEWLEIASTGYDALPAGLIDYANYIQNNTGVPLEIISIGPGREATIELR
ncbi:MAG: adenylosuccinate synthase [Thermoplasmata archaeon]|nr:adenylosuccinate synthase [Thermoplasmata archaeon]